MRHHDPHAGQALAALRLERCVGDVAAVVQNVLDCPPVANGHGKSRWTEHVLDGKRSVRGDFCVT